MTSALYRVNSIEGCSTKSSKRILVLVHSYDNHIKVIAWLAVIEQWSATLPPSSENPDDCITSRSHNYHQKWWLQTISRHAGNVCSCGVSLQVAVLHNYASICGPLDNSISQIDFGLSLRTASSVHKKSPQNVAFRTTLHHLNSILEIDR